MAPTTSGRLPPSRHDLLGSQLRQQFADAVWPDQRHPAPIRDCADGRLHVVLPDARIAGALWLLRQIHSSSGIAKKWRFTSVAHVLYVGEDRHYGD